MNEAQKEQILDILDKADSLVWNVFAEQEPDKLGELEHDEYRGDECDGQLAGMLIHMLKVKHGVTHTKDADRVPYQTYDDWLD